MAKYPGLSQTVQNVFEAIGRGANPTQFYDRIVVRRARYVHRLNVAAAALTSLAFFNATPAAGVTNWNPGGLPLENAYWLRALRFKVESNIAATSGAEVTANRLITADTATNPAALDVAETLRRLFQQGIVNLTVGTRKIVDNDYGLDSFPQGSGFHIDPAVASTDTTVSAASANVSNGAPDASNTFDLGWIPVLPQKAAALTVDWLPSTTAPATAFVLTAIMDGWLVTPQSL